MLGDLESLQEILSALNVDSLVVRVVPVKVSNALLEPKEVVNRRYDDVNGGRIACLSAEVVLEVSVVAFTEKLEKSKETSCEHVIGKDFAENWEIEIHLHVVNT